MSDDTLDRSYWRRRHLFIRRSNRVAEAARWAAALALPLLAFYVLPRVWS